MLRTFILAALLALPAAAQSQDAPRPFTVAGTLIALSVSSLDSTVAWYRDKLGLRVTMHTPRSATANGLAILEGGGLLVEIQEHAGAAAPDRNPSARQGIFKAGIYVDDFDAAVAALRARGVAFAIGPFPRRPDQPANGIIRDNSGNYIQILGR